MLISAVCNWNLKYQLKKAIYYDTLSTVRFAKTRGNYASVSEATKHLFDIYVDIELDAGVPMFGLVNPFELLTLFRCCAPRIDFQNVNEMMGKKAATRQAKTKHHLKYRSSICLDMCCYGRHHRRRRRRRQTTTSSEEMGSGDVCAMTTSIFTNYIHICKHCSCSSRLLPLILICVLMYHGNILRFLHTGVYVRWHPSEFFLLLF